MPIDLAELLVTLAALYLGIGAIFSLPFGLRGIEKIDRTARGSGVFFRLMITPGVIALWPLLAFRWWQATGDPPTESNAHRNAAQTAARSAR